MLKVTVTHTDLHGVVTTYTDYFKSTCDAIIDCGKTFGMGKVKAVVV